MTDPLITLADAPGAACQGDDCLVDTVAEPEAAGSVLAPTIAMSDSR